MPLLTAQVTTPITAALPAATHAPLVTVAPVPATPLAHNTNIADVLPPATYTVAPPAAPGGVLSLTAQHVHIQETVRGSLLVIEADIAFQDGFPDGHGRNQFVNNALIQTAHLLNYLGLERRFNEDRLFMRSIATIVSGDQTCLLITHLYAQPKQRISTFRGALKKITDASVTAHYHLTPADCLTNVPILLKNMSYMYALTFGVSSVFSSVLGDACTADLCCYLRQMGSMCFNTTSRMRTRASRAHSGPCSSQG